jgi:hypothetical protein
VIRASVIARLTKYSRQDGDCIRWTGVRGAKGYGHIGVDGKTRIVHRVAYELLVGPIPDGLEIDHRCRVRDCINVAHLEPVSHVENVRRRRDNPDHCAQGHPFTEENTYWARWRARPNPIRKCKRCRHMYKARRWAQAKAAREPTP